eukprot:768624-Hanusia_phi.AAC.9
MNIFAPNKVVAKSRFWYYMSLLKRVKKANGEILQINEVRRRTMKAVEMMCNGNSLYGQCVQISMTTSSLCFWFFLLRPSMRVFEKKPSTVSNYGIWMRYDSRTGHHNMYREYRDVSICGAVSKMYQDVAARHRSRFTNVQIVRTAQVPDDMLRKSWNKEYLERDIKFPLTHRVLRPSSKALKKTFVARRPRTCFDK